MKCYQIFIDELICKGCELCVFYCPKDVLQMSDKLSQKGYNIAQAIYADNCIGCMLCVIGCPDLAIQVEETIDQKVGKES
jgi:2-oxoglutarate ferredoxin oxidoreductase subunit delta